MIYVICKFFISIQAFIYSKSDPALENCSDITFGPYNFHYPKAREHFTKAKFDTQNPGLIKSFFCVIFFFFCKELNKWSQVFDFTPNAEKRNWRIINPEDFYINTQKLPDYENETIEEIVPLPKIYGGVCEFPIIIGSQDSQTIQGQGRLNFH